MKNKKTSVSPEEKKTAKAEKAAAKKKKRQLRAICILSGLLIAALLVFGTVMAVKAIRNAYLNSGAAYRSDVIFKTEHHELNAAMFSYRFYDAFYNGALEGDYDDPEQLKNVESPVSDMSLFEYNRNNVLISMKNTLRYAEEATKNGFALDDRDKDCIFAKLQSIERKAKNAGVSQGDYLFAVYGRGVRLSDIEDLLTLEALAEKQWCAYEISVQISESEIDDYLKKLDADYYNRMDFYIVDLTPPSSGGDVPEEKLQIAFERAKRLAECSSEEEFKAYAKVCLTELYKDDPSVSESDVNEIYESCFFSGRQIVELDDTAPASSKWLYSPDRKAGDAYTDDAEPVVYFIGRARYSIDTPNDTFLVLSLDLDDYPSRDDALKKFNTLIDLYESGSCTEDAFKELVRAYDTNPVSAAKAGFYDDTASSSAFPTCWWTPRTFCWRSM